MELPPIVSLSSIVVIFMKKKLYLEEIMYFSILSVMIGIWAREVKPLAKHKVTFLAKNTHRPKTYSSCERCSWTARSQRRDRVTGAVNYVIWQVTVSDAVTYRGKTTLNHVAEPWRKRSHLVVARSAFCIQKNHTALRLWFGYKQLHATWACKMYSPSGIEGFCDFS